jgi:hypothetical protein
VLDPFTDFIEEIRAAPQYLAAVEQDAAWAGQLADLQDNLSAIAVHDGAREIEVCDELVSIVTRKSVPVGERVIAVRGALAKAHFAKHPRAN